MSEYALALKIESLTAENKRLLEIVADAKIRLDDRRERIEQSTAENKRLREVLLRIVDGSLIDGEVADAARAALTEREKE